MRFSSSLKSKGQRVYLNLKGPGQGSEVTAFPILDRALRHSEFYSKGSVLLSFQLFT